MISIKKTDYVYRITLPKNKDVNIVNVYNNLFFSIFPLKGLRVYKNEKQIVDPVVQENITLDDDENKLVNVFGKEKIPNSYSTLPLAKDESKELDRNNTSNNDDENEDLYDTMSSYLTKYLPTMFSKENIDNTDNFIHITIPINNNQPVILLEDLLNNHENNELYNIDDNTIDYSFLEKLIKDFYIQIEFLLNNDYVFSDISLNSIIHVQNRFVIFDSANIEILKENRDEKIKNMNRAFLKLISDILKLNVSSDKLLEKLKNIQNTEVFYFLKRIEREGKMLWL